MLGIELSSPSQGPASITVLTAHIPLEVVHITFKLLYLLIPIAAKSDDHVTMVSTIYYSNENPALALLIICRSRMKIGRSFDALRKRRVICPFRELRALTSEVPMLVGRFICATCRWAESTRNTYEGKGTLCTLIDGVDSSFGQQLIASAGTRDSLSSYWDTA